VAEEFMAKTILVVDDEKRILSLLKAYLEQQSFHVATATNGKEALFIARHEKPDLIILDIMMPGMDGFEATRKIRNGDCGEGNREAFIIAVTGCSDDEDRDRGFNAGVNAYLTKPLTIDALRETINDYNALSNVV
jgi:CheY-like chemotaxis protein